MAVRYSGDVEVRMKKLPRGMMRVTLNAPRTRYTLTVRSEECHTPSDYDRLARRTLVHAAKEFAARGVPFPAERKGGGFVVKRVFQAPCPARCPG